MTSLRDLPMSLVALTLTLYVFVNATSNNDILKLNATSPFDPFEELRIRAIPQPSEPVCCLIPLSSDPLPLSADFISFEEWKSKQLELQAQGANQTPLPDVSEAQPGASPVTSATVLGEADASFFYQTEAVPSVSRHFRVPLTDRFNYASLDCSARVHTSHSSARSPSAILSSKKDWYMLSPCAVDPNFVVVELCDDIRIDTVQLANFEFFSGVFRDFRVSVAQTYTPDGQAWTEAGTYRAKNIRGVQSFHPLVELRPFYRFIRIDFLTHYGSEFYCPISLLRVYGLTQMEEWKLEVWQGGSEGSSPEVLNEIVATDKVNNESIPGGSMVANGTYLLEPKAERTAAPAEIIVDEDGADHSLSTIEGSLVKDREAQGTSSPHIPPTSVLRIPTSEPSPILEPSIAPNSETTLAANIATASHMHSIIKNGESRRDISSFVEESLAVENTTSVIVPNASQPISIPLPTSSTQTLLLPSPTPIPSGESIYRTIMNRLTMLETNTTLYQQYVAEQTLQLRRALGRLEEEVGRLEGISKAQQQTFVKLVHDLERRRSQMEEERWELLNKVNHLADEVILEKRLSIAQLWLLLTVLVFMTLTRGSRADAVSLLDGTMHRLNGFGRRSTRSSADWTRHWTSRSPTPNARHKSTARAHQKDITSAMIPQPRPGTGVLSPEPVVTTPPARSQTPRSHSCRPSNPRNHGNIHLGNSERPTRRLRRSNSYTTVANTHLSPKRFARSAHLHELQHSIRRHARTSGSDEEAQSEGDGILDKSPRRRGNRMDHLPGPQMLPSWSISSPRKVADCEGSEADSWVDTEAGSEPNIDSAGTEFEEAGGQGTEIRPGFARLRRPILSSPPSKSEKTSQEPSPGLPSINGSLIT